MTRLVRFAFIIGLALAPRPIAAQERPARPARHATIEFLDVGQGDAILIRSPEGKSALVDAGPQKELAAELLRRRGITSLDLVVLTHHHQDHVRRVTTFSDRRGTRQGLTARPLGQRTNLDAKAEGDNSMSVKPGYDGTTQSQAGRDPVGTVKPGLVEPECPTCQWCGPDTVVDIRYQLPRGGDSGPPHPSGPKLGGPNLRPEGHEMGTYPDLNVRSVRNTRYPTGREPYGYGAPVVVRARESRAHGEGGQGGMHER
jgi:Metallo-beta-lactamase superfamily